MAIIDLTGESFADIWPRLAQVDGALIANSEGTTLDTINAATMLQIGGSAVYEKDTYEVTLTPSNSGTITLGDDTLTYTRKFNGEVTVSGYITVDSVSSPAGYMSLSLPFAVGAGNQNRSTGSMFFGTVVSADISDFVMLLLGGATSARVYLGDGTSAQSDSAEQVQSGTTAHFNFTYFT